ncbi:myrosinase 1-like isoform X1 [Diabrotica virgifera virgifera]|uniref:Myrosinase 1-like n=2 Tax=Diabrotica virgifera virgifera TaxID=50390 RepID=A0ABM5K3P5_DIAVI|nr:myrosinase 1-like isoform X1 [Diabrotica virgifera virgifera]
MLLNFRVLILTVSFSNILAEDYVINNKRFPADFMFGVATSAYQVEGGWNEDGKGVNIWDYFTHRNSSVIRDKNNGDIACDSYHRIKEDIAILKDLGVSHYRFSISWPRILPNGFRDEVNQKGIDYYKNLIKELKDNNIEPLVTLYHWDLPQFLQDLGGFFSSSLEVWFAEYARICFEAFGKDVKYWVTFNEPSSICNNGYGKGKFAPGIYNPGIGEYLCIHNLLNAHAAAYHVYDKEFRSTYNGKVTTVHSISYCQPKTNTTEDIEAADQKMQFNLGWMADPIYFGDYPEIMKTRIATRSKLEGFIESRLPEFTEEQKERLKNTSDYFAVNSYDSYFAFAIPEPAIVLPPSLDADSGVGGTKEGIGDGSFGMGKLLLWIKDRYNNPDMIITENGLMTQTETLEDDDRISMVKNCLSRFRDVMDQVNLLGYTLWSVMDNFEWTRGYTAKYGIYHVDFNNSNRTRTPKKSAEWYKHVIQTRCLTDICVD